MHLELIDTILALLVIAVAICWVFWRFKLPIIAGYIVVGIIVGPQALGWIQNTPITREIAELGVVFLLFTIGLEFSFNKLFSMAKTVFGLGGLQVILSVAATIVVAQWLGMSWAESVVVGGIVATSSTAIVLKQLAQQGELKTPQGKNAIGILLFQDLAVIPLIVIIPSLVGEDLSKPLGWALVKGFVAIVVILAIGRWVLNPLFHRIAQMKSSEVFTLVTLLVALGAAWVSDNLGLSLALGAFVAGVMLSETEFRKQLDMEMRPFRDILLGLFFISIGSQFNLETMPDTWPWVLALFSALVVFKTVLISLLGLLFGNNRIVSFRTGLILAQGSEFGFTILFLSNQYRILPPDYAEVVLGALLLSFIASSLLIRYSDFITRLVDGTARRIFFLR